MAGSRLVETNIAVTDEHVLRDPVVVVGATGAGVSALTAALTTAPGAWDASGTLLPGMGRDEALAALRDADTAVDREHLPGDVTPRMVVGVEAQSQRVRFLAELLPDAQFVWLHRGPAQTIAGLVASSEETDAATLIDEWESATRTALTDLRTLPSQRWCVASFENLAREPETELQRLCAHLGLGWHATCSVTWSRLGRAVVASLADAQPVTLPASVEALAGEIVAEVPELLRSLQPETPEGSMTAHDDGLAKLLRGLGSSLLVSTYQTNRVISLRPEKGHLSVHMRSFDRPMGIAVTPGGFALGVRAEVLDYRDFPAVAQNLEPKGRNDACYVPRNSHVTGDIAVHDLGMGRDGLWLVATKFSCLATLDSEHSFVPRWRPPFISALAPEDRCHLNGMAMVDGVPRYVTALGVSDVAGGWRADKAHAGVVMEVPSGEVVISGLSMPHSPRWHDGRLWVLESGKGQLVVCDLENGTTEVVAQLPGFTRGLSFHGRYAFVGTSQIRETATFGGLPIAEQGPLECGVWAIDIVTGEVVAAVRFADRVQEIFDVAVLDGVRHPEVAEPNSDLARTSWLLPAQQ